MGLHCGDGQKRLGFLNQRHIFTAPSPKPATMDLPSGENPQAEALCSSIIRRSWPVAASHNITILSFEVLRMVCPSGEKTHLPTITIFALGSTYNIHRITLIRTCVLSCSHNTLALDRIHNTDYCAVAPLVRVGVEPLVVPGIILYRTRTALYDSNSMHAVIQY